MGTQRSLVSLVLHQPRAPGLQWVPSVCVSNYALRACKSGSSNRCGEDGWVWWVSGGGGWVGGELQVVTGPTGPEGCFVLVMLDPSSFLNQHQYPPT